MIAPQIIPVILKFGRPFAIEHAVKFPQRDQTEDADQSVESDFVTGERDYERDRPEHNRAHEAQYENRASRYRFWRSLVERHGHEGLIFQTGDNFVHRLHRFPRIIRILSDESV